MHQDAARWWMCLMLKDKFGDKNEDEVDGEDKDEEVHGDKGED